MRTNALTSRHRVARAFTLLEVLLVVVIMTILAALLFVAIGAAVRSVRLAAEREYVRSLAVAVEQYKQSFGAVPPLVADGATDNTGPLVANPGAGQPARPRFKGEDASGDLSRCIRFARYEVDADNPPAVTRYSVHTLPIYVLGVLGKKYDGVDGPGFTKPDSDGVFARAGASTKALFDVSKNAERVKRPTPNRIGSEDDDACRTYLVDRWGNPIRYYRWLPTYHTAGSPMTSVFPGAPSNQTGQAKEIRSFNVPPGVGDPVTNPALRSARCAIVSAGPDGRIDDTDPNSPDNLDNIVEVVQ